MRLQKYLAQCGVASRRKAEELIAQGRVKVNGIVVTDMGVKVAPGMQVLVDGKEVVQEENKVYVLINKPAGYVTTSKDQFSRKTVLDLVSDIKERIYPVGRLDYDTSGLLILTNDGDFSYRLTHPSHEIHKTYLAEIEGLPSLQEIELFQKGLHIEDYKTAPARLRIVKSHRERPVVEITIHEGRNRQVKKMCAAIGHPVISLKRISIGEVKLGNMLEGHWRHLTSDELKSLEGKNQGGPEAAPRI